MYKRGIRGWAKHLDFIILDCACLEISLLIAYMIRHGVSNPFSTELYRMMFSMVLILNFVLLIFMDTMKDVLKRGYYKEFRSTFWQAAMLFLCTTAYMFMAKTGDAYSRMTILLMTGIYLVLTYLVRILWKKIVLRELKGKGYNALLIMASEENASELIQEVKANNYGKHKIVGAVIRDADKVGKLIDDIPVVATYDNIIEYVTKNWVDEILVTIDKKEPFPANTIETLAGMGVTVHLNMDTLAKPIGVKQVIGEIGGMLVVSTSMNNMTARQYVLKRGMDIIGGIVGCIITGILYLILAPAIKRESPGPAFFSQTRIGKNGKPFKIYKFRSMYLDAEERKAELLEQNRVSDGMMFKMEFDPRVIGNKIDKNGKQVTGIGEFMRKYSLDEFPQFFNVLKGDMSLVGTRPPLPDEYEKYAAHHKARLAAKPGITGLWQISGRSNIMDFEEVVRLDTQYISNWGIGLDLRILMKTFGVVMRKEGAV